MSEHSPLPWRIAEEMGSDYIRWLQGADEYDICRFEMDNDIDRDNLAFIVKAVNNHNKLAEALGLAALLLGCGDAYDDFEELADLFYRETSYMRPGKSDVRGFHTDEERRARFMEWVASKKGNIAAALAALKEDAK